MNFSNANEAGIKNKATVVGMMEATINTCPEGEVTDGQWKRQNVEKKEEILDNFIQGRKQICCKGCRSGVNKWHL